MSGLLKWRQIDKFDGQNVYSNNKVIYEVGNYLGGGSSGSVYQATDPSCVSDKSVALKILNPLGYKCFTSTQVEQSIILRKGVPWATKNPISTENIWWLLYPPTKQIFAAFEDQLRPNTLRELPLTKCVELWQWNPLNAEMLSEAELEKINIDKSKTATHLGRTYKLPIVSPRYLKFLKSRQLICREMHNMARIGGNANIVDLIEVLEMIQESKATLFLVLELVTGGELFDRMKSNIYNNNPEEFAHRYFSQLISGLDYCHKKGIVHRDLKPENLLLSDGSDHAILKIADFGLSAVILSAESQNQEVVQVNTVGTLPCSFDLGIGNEKTTAPSGHGKLTGGGEIPPLRRLRSVVGSPHYIAPEISAQEDPLGYDGCKVDMWSAGVILYSLFTGALPFGSDLSRCTRFKQFKQFISNEYQANTNSVKECSLPAWFWPPNLASHPVASLIVGLLHFDPAQRLTAAEVKKHPWCSSNPSIVVANSSNVPPLQKSTNSGNSNFLLNKGNTTQLSTIEERSLSSGSNSSNHSNNSNHTNNSTISAISATVNSANNTSKTRRVSNTPLTKSLATALEDDQFNRLSINGNTSNNLLSSKGNIDPSPVRKKRGTNASTENTTNSNL